jgi:Leu/Phe-tRNA-protein transferase
MKSTTTQSTQAELAGGVAGVVLRDMFGGKS